MGPFVEGRARYTLLLLSASVDERPSGALGANDLCSRVDVRLTEERPMSARLVPDDERWKSGWLGRDMARDCLDPDIDRTWPLEKGAPELELDRFMADAG